MRISGVNIQDKKHLDVALTSIYGIGRKRAQNILDSVGVGYSKKATELTQDQENKIRKLIVETEKVEGDLKREVSGNIKRLKDIKAYRGVRHLINLPVRGQRTKTNARSRKGARKTMGSGKVKLQKK